MLKKEDVIEIYEKLVAKAIKPSLRKEVALEYIIAASMWMYDYNIIYTDNRLESRTKEIGASSLPIVEINNPDGNRVCFIDNFGLDNRGLTQQYLRALMSDSREILYILHNGSPISNSEIIRELKEYPKAQILIIKKKKGQSIKCALEILSGIENFKPREILIHIAPWDIETLLALSRVTGVTSYNINLTDHAFWLGATFVDYNIEFRGMGVTISNQKRGISKERQLYLPYYPIISKYIDFKGFPELPSDAIIVLCGGSEYKMLGENGMFFHMMEAVLAVSPKVHIMVAGINSESVFAQEVAKMADAARVHLIGNRKDIAEVFNHSDIYLSSYPFFGGLMSQFAAFYAKPLLIYKNGTGGGNPSEVVNHLSYAVKPCDGFDKFKEYASRLILDESFRKVEGEGAHNALITEDLFNKALIRLLDYHESNFEYTPIQPDYNYMINFYLELKNKYLRKPYNALFCHLKLKSYVAFPSKFLDITKTLYKATLNKIKR